MILLAFDLGNEFDANFTLIVGVIAALAIAVVVVRIILFYLFGSPPPSDEPRPVRSATLPPSTTEDEGGGGGSQSSPTEPKFTQVECQKMRNKALSAFRPRSTDWKGQYWRRICEQIAKGERLPDINLAEFVQTRDVDTQHVMRDLLALSGEIDLFLRLLELNPNLKTATFCKKMARLYDRLIAEIEGREVSKSVLLQRFRDAVRLEKAAPV